MPRVRMRPRLGRRAKREARRRRMKARSSRGDGAFGSGQKDDGGEMVGIRRWARVACAHAQAVAFASRDVELDRSGVVMAGAGLLNHRRNGRHEAVVACVAAAETGGRVRGWRAFRGTCPGAITATLLGRAAATTVRWRCGGAGTKPKPTGVGNADREHGQNACNARHVPLSITQIVAEAFRQNPVR